LVVAGAQPAEEEQISLEEGVRRARALYAQGVRMKDAVKQVAKETGLPKNELYQLTVTWEE
ncbi:MAG: 16S rRNA (cytidine(1402)-2'-O)-methyltransferase, partial [Oscillospiraceae bacterium]|nr:16S rRNA (cytidine(1402)-2'-O)-methyltransferase [Oscillospiraceae bacterium]